MILIQGAEVYAPAYLGRKDILLAGGKIEQIEDHISFTGNVPCKVIDGMGKYVFPGFIDNHVHVTGGGGEGGFVSRTPEIGLTDIIDGGITTIIGTLGTDGYGRTMADLLAKIHGLQEEGITAYANTGSYQIPVKTLTGAISTDIMFLDPVLGVGEIAVSDHRSSCPTIEELEKIVSETRVAGMIAGKVGIVNIHIGDEPEILSKIKTIVTKCRSYKKHFHPTHMNRSREVFEDALAYLEMGGSVDFTTSTTPEFLAEGEVACADGAIEIYEKGLDFSKLTFSSDGQGSLPMFDAEGNMSGVQVGRVTSLYGAVQEAIRKGLPIEKAISVITSNVADIYGLKDKGYVREQADADLVLVDPETLEIHTMIAGGTVLRENYRNLRKGTFE